MSPSFMKFANSSGNLAGDFATIKKIDLDYFPWPWSDHSWSDFISKLDSQRFQIYFVKTDVEVVGFILFELSVADSFAHLLKIVINPSKRQKGLGRDLLKFAMNDLVGMGMKSFFLEVEENNSPAIGLYEGVGFKIIHKKKQFYSDGSTALILLLEV